MSTQLREKVLEEVQANGRVNQRELAERLGIQRRSMYQITRGLVEDGLIMRRPSLTDARTTLLLAA